MTWDASSDLASTLVAVAPSPTPASSLSLTVTAGAGALFPVAPFDVLIHDQAVWPTKTTAEFARVLSVVGDVVTFSARALHGSSARTILVGDRISGVFTAEQLQAIQAQIDANTAAISTNVTAITSKAPLTSPALTGTPTTPTPTPGDNSTKIASTAFVLANAPSGGLTSFQGRSTAAAVLTKADVTGTGLAAADVGAALDSTAVHNTGAETVAGVKTFSSSPIVPDPTTAQQVASRAFVLANAGGGPNAVNRTLSTAGSVSGATPLDMTKDQTRQFVLSGNTVISASAVAANGGRLTLYADQPPSGGLYTLGISDGTTTFPVTDPGWTAGQRMTVLVDWFSPTAFSANVLGVAAAPVIPTVPVNTVAPVISGTGSPGNVLTATAGTWTGTPTPTIGYQWQRAGVNISGATASTYTLALADDGNAVTCLVTATNTAGSASQASNAITPALSLPVNTVAPTVSGSTPVGSVLTASPGTWTGSPAPTFAYQWTSAGTNISGATASTYTTVSGDATHAIGCKVTGTNASGSAGPVASSNTITPVAGATPALLTHTAASGATADSVTTPAIDTTGATLLVVAVSSYNVAAPARVVTDSKGNTWVSLTAVLGSAGGHSGLGESQFFYCSSPTVGTGHTFTQTSTGSIPAIAVAAFSGTTGAADINIGAAGGPGTAQPGSATPAQSGEVIVTMASFNQNIAVTVDSGFTITDQIPYTGGAGLGVALAYKVKTDALAENPTWSGTGMNAAVAMASVRHG